jgi:hypothetical protein
MSRHEVIKELKQEQEEVEVQISRLDEALVQLFNQQYYYKLLSDKRILSVKLDNISKKINNLTSGKPLLGYEESPIKQVN